MILLGNGFPRKAKRANREHTVTPGAHRSTPSRSDPSLQALLDFPQPRPAPLILTATRILKMMSIAASPIICSLVQRQLRWVRSCTFLKAVEARQHSPHGIRWLSPLSVNFPRVCLKHSAAGRGGGAPYEAWSSGEQSSRAPCCPSTPGSLKRFRLLSISQT